MAKCRPEVGIKDNKNVIEDKNRTKMAGLEKMEEGKMRQCRYL